MTQPHIHYAVRQHLPRDRWRTLLPRMIDAFTPFSISEVVLITFDVVPFGPRGGFLPLDQVRADCDDYRQMAREIERAGMTASLNPYWSVGHGSTFDFRQGLGLDVRVNETGQSEPGTVCILDPRYREHIARVFELYAGVGFHAIWIEDDLRYLWGCFCDRHVAAFNQKYGTRHDRESLVKAILLPGAGQPDPARGQWFDEHSSQIIDLVASLRKAVHTQNPQTHLGLMTSSPDAHATTGRRWLELADAATGPPGSSGNGRPLYIRPNYPPYREMHLWLMPIALSVTRQTLAAVSPHPVRAFPEIDNWEPGPFNRSPQYIATQVMLAVLLGIRQFHYSIFEFLGNDDTFDESAEFGSMLREHRPIYDKLLTWVGENPRQHGVQLLWHERAARHIHTPSGQSRRELSPESLPWAVALQLMGFPVTWQDSPVKAASGDLIDAFSDEEIQRMLAGGLLLDAGAAAALIRRGFGDMIGIAQVQPLPPQQARTEPALVERIDDASMAEPGTLVRCTSLASVGWSQLQLAGAHVHSTLLSYEGRELAPAVTSFTNGQGGRVVVVNLPSIAEPFFRSPRRQQQFRGLLNWLFGDRPQMQVHDAPNVAPLLLETDTHWIAAVANVRTQAARGLRVVLRGLNVTNVEALLYDGQKLTPMPLTAQSATGKTTFTASDPIPILGMLLLRWAKPA